VSVNNVELPGYMVKDLDLWLKLASESGVEVLELCLPDGPNMDEIKSLTELVLMGESELIQHS